MANGELQSLVNFRQPLNSTLRAAPYKLVLSSSPYYVDFRTLVGSDLDGTPFKPYGMYIDNTQGTENLIILFQETQYRVVCKKGEVLNTSYPAADYAIAAITGNGPASIIFVDYSVEPYSSNLTGGSAMAIWGAITGTLSNQTDLQAALDSKVDKVAGFGLSQNSFTNANLTKLNGIEAGAQVNTVNSVAGKTGVVTLSPSDVGFLPGAWTNLTLTNGWTTDSGAPDRARVRKIGPFVQIEAVIQRNAGASTASPFSLPTGFIPSSFTSILGLDYSGTVFRVLVATAGGAVITNGVSMANIQFFGVIFYVG